jgi:hypothetical protein
MAHTHRDPFENHKETHGEYNNAPVANLLPNETL